MFELLMILTHSRNGLKWLPWSDEHQQKRPSDCCWAAASAMQWGLSWPQQSWRVEIPPTWGTTGAHARGPGWSEYLRNVADFNKSPNMTYPKGQRRNSQGWQDTHGDKVLWLVPVPFPAHGRRVLWPDVVLLASDSLGSRCGGHNA